ncbi:MAG TPA: sugar phosphate nucleotidyltransferase [Candidatus Limnocylindrales bacterium]|nr:sugar phosphate nucleotidyltransferase [Candidatus Limnocylindrales bacterium]
MYVVILAGGGGTRLWPLSRPETPKPFLPLLGDRSLLQRTVDRVTGHEELPIDRDDVAVVTDRRYAQLVRDQLPGIRILGEPSGRNTAAAIALAALHLERPEDEVMVVLPADHLIEDEAAFRAVLRAAADLAARGAFGIETPLVTLGAQVDRAATEYGYLMPDIDAGARTPEGFRAYPLRAFEEKPTEVRAGQLLAEPGVAWNAGIFLWRRQAILDALGRYTGLPTLLGTFASSDAGLAAAYDQLRPVSIDVAVMEGAASDHRVAMIGMNVGWNDLGSWTALLHAIGGTGTGSVIQPSEPAEAGPEDLIVERSNGRLTVDAGPRGILATAPTALLRGAAAARPAVDALIDRVTRWEDRP